MYSQYKTKTNRKLHKMDVTHGPSPKALHQIDVIILLIRIHCTMNAEFTCSWLPLLEQNYILCDIYFGRKRDMACFDKCAVWCVFRLLYLLFSLPGMLFLQISTCGPPTSSDLCSTIFFSAKSCLPSLL